MGSRLNIGDDWLRHVFAAFIALCYSSLIRLMEYFVSAGKAVAVLHQIITTNLKGPA